MGFHMIPSMHQLHLHVISQVRCEVHNLNESACSHTRPLQALPMPVPRRAALPA